MKKLWGMLRYEECECHPMPSFGPFKTYPLEYIQEMQMPPVGAIMIDLARPYKGTRTFGVFVKAFGKLWIFSPVWTHAKR